MANVQTSVVEVSTPGTSWNCAWNWFPGAAFLKCCTWVSAQLFQNVVTLAELN